MFKLRIGVPIDYDSHDMHAGGSFSYTTGLIRAINQYHFPEELEIVFVDFTGKAKVNTQKELISFHPFAKFNFADFSRKLMIEGLKKFRGKVFSKFYQTLENKHAKRRSANIRKKLIENRIHMLFYVKPDGFDGNFPFITIHWDIGHRSTYMFPEFNESFESREGYYNTTLNRALYILTETQAGKNELVKYANINADRIGVMPIFPGGVINENATTEVQNQILESFELIKNQFFIYPAQFWPHKNHRVLIEAMEEITKLHPNVKLILTGSNKGNLSYIENYIKEHNLSCHIKILGFVSNEALFTFYKNAIALVMPTYLGPSNMPPLEAAFLNCPVIISNIEGHRELMKDYATYFDPSSVDDLTSKMLQQINSPHHGKTFDTHSFNIDAAMKELETALLKIRPIRATWGH